MLPLTSKESTILIHLDYFITAIAVLIAINLYLLILTIPFWLDMLKYPNWPIIL